MLHIAEVAEECIWCILQNTTITKKQEDTLWEV